MTCYVLEGQQRQASYKEAAMWADIAAWPCNGGHGS
jgi:hypothetical protein